MYNITLITENKITLGPFFVSHVIPNLFAITEAVIVEPLLPPQPTNITPSFGTWRCVRK